MPGHKGRLLTGPEAADLTEIDGADVLYRSRGIIRESEDNAASLFGTARTVYSAEGSSLCIRAMLYLAMLTAKERHIPLRLLAGRNAHRTLMTAAALLDLEVEWLLPAPGEDLLSCTVTADMLEEKMRGQQYMAVYLTSPDYLGRQADLSKAAAVCRRHGVPLLVDNAHGAYLKFLSQGIHPLTLGADLCCDSAHKTLPVLTGGAYLHISKTAPSLFAENTDRAMALFASTSPSYLILQSLDACNAYLDSGYRERLAALIHKLDSLKTQLTAYGYSLIGDEPIKLTLAPKSYGYTGDELHDLLRVHNMECEFSDPDFLTLMFTPDTTDEALHHLQSVLLDVPRKAAISVQTPPLPHPERVLSIRDAMLSPGVEIAIEEAEGRIFADAHVGCPPCIPIIAAGERIDQNAVRCFRYYGIKTCQVIP